MSEKIALLNKDYDLSTDSDIDLVKIMKRLCDEYEMCRNSMSTATCKVWDCIVRVAEEIMRRSGQESKEMSPQLKEGY